VKNTFLEDEFARNQTGAPLEFLGTMLPAVGSDVFLGNAKHHGSDFGPDTGTRAHSTRLVCGIQHEIRQITAVAEEIYFNVSSSTCLMDEVEVFTRLPAGAITTS
jgi:hypothetical protein